MIPSRWRIGSESHARASLCRRTCPRRPSRTPCRPWSKSHEKLALLYNEQGLRLEPGRREETGRLAGLTHALSVVIPDSDGAGTIDAVSTGCRVQAVEEYGLVFNTARNA